MGVDIVAVLSSPILAASTYCVQKQMVENVPSDPDSHMTVSPYSSFCRQLAISLSPPYPTNPAVPRYLHSTPSPSPAEQELQLR